MNILCDTIYVIMYILCIFYIFLKFIQPNYKQISKYQSRIVERTYANNKKTYSLQFKKLWIWWTFDTYLDFETCEEYYKFLQQYEEKLNEIKLNTKILEEKLINIK